METPGKEFKSHRKELPPPNIPDTIRLLKNASLDSARVFVMAGTIRAGINIVIKVLATIQKGKSFKSGLLKAIIGKDVRRTCIFLSGFTFTWKFLSRLLPRIVGYRTRTTDFLSGLIAGVFILAERKDRRISFSHQLAVRGGQSFFTSLSNRNIFHIPNAAALLYILSTAQIQYSYVLHPTTLPVSIYKFMIHIAKVPRSILEVNRQVLNGQAVDSSHVTELVKNLKGTENALQVASNLPTFPPQLPCCFFHPDIDSCSLAFTSLFFHAFRTMLPLNAGLTFIPAILFNFPQLSAKPKETLLKCTAGALRSSVALATSTSLFLKIICNSIAVFDRLNIPDFKFKYFLAGFLTSSFVMIEHPSRRVELALYVLPKAIDSLYKILYAKNRVFVIPHFEVMLFMFASGTIMLKFRREPETVSPMLRFVLSKLLRENHK